MVSIHCLFFVISCCVMLCAHTTRILRAYFAHTTRTLRAYYAHTTRILRAYYAHTMRTLRAYYAHTTRILRTYSAHTTRTLRTYCAHTAHTMRAYCAHTARVLCTPVASIVCWGDFMCICVFLWLSFVDALYCLGFFTCVLWGGGDVFNCCCIVFVCADVCGINLDF